jgi:heptosyltransferase-1
MIQLANARLRAHFFSAPEGVVSIEGQTPRGILVVRLGAMGDIIHTLPAVVRLKQHHPDSRLTWLVEPRWAPLLEGNPFVDRVMLLHRQSPAGLWATRRELRTAHYDLAVDFQGLLKSALAGRAARPDRFYGLHESQVRERLAAWFYTDQTLCRAEHVVDRNLELAAACGGSALAPAPAIFPLPPGRPEGDLPPGDFVLASPLAGWASKQWPMDHYRGLAARLRRELGVPLVLDGPAGADFTAAEAAIPHHSSLAGLIYATRRAVAVVGVDSGPLHLAAALSKPGVAIFGPTDPARNGPYGDSLRVLRTAAATTTYKRGGYKRGDTIDSSMRNISPDEVFEVLRALIGALRRPAGSLAE